MVLLEEAGVDCRAPKRSSSGARTCSASRWPSSCSAPTRPSRSATRARATSRAVCARADVLIAAIGRPRMLGAEHVKPGAVVIDVGMNRISPEEAGTRAASSATSTHAAVPDIASRDHAGARRRRPDDDRDAAAQHAAGRARAGRAQPRRGGSADEAARRASWTALAGIGCMIAVADPALVRKRRPATSTSGTRSAAPPC